MAQMQASVSATCHTTREELKFPSRRDILWDRRTIGPVRHCTLPQVCKISVRVPSEVARHLSNRRGSLLGHCSLTNQESKYSVESSEGKPPGFQDAISATIAKENILEILVERFDRIPDAEVGLGMCVIHLNSTNAVSLRDARMQARGQLPLEAFFSFEAYPSCDKYSSRVDLSIRASVPKVSLTLSPISNLPLVRTPLGERLLKKERRHNMGYGFVTLDKTRRCVPLLENDPAVGKTCLVGVWVDMVGSQAGFHGGGSGYTVSDLTTKTQAEEILTTSTSTLSFARVDHPAIWMSCMRYLTTECIGERVFIAPRTFLIMLVSPPQSECTTGGIGMDLRHPASTSLESNQTRFFEVSFNSFTNAQGMIDLARCPNHVFEGTVSLDYDTNIRKPIILRLNSETNPVGSNTGVENEGSRAVAGVVSPVGNNCNNNMNFVGTSPTLMDSTAGMSSTSSPKTLLKTAGSSGFGGSGRSITGEKKTVVMWTGGKVENKIHCTGSTLNQNNNTPIQIQGSTVIDLSPTSRLKMTGNSSVCIAKDTTLLAELSPPTSQFPLAKSSITDKITNLASPAEVQKSVNAIANTGIGKGAAKTPTATCTRGTTGNPKMSTVGMGLPFSSTQLAGLSPEIWMFLETQQRQLSLLQQQVSDLTRALLQKTNDSSPRGRNRDRSEPNSPRTRAPDRIHGHHHHGGSGKRSDSGRKNGKHSPEPRASDWKKYDLNNELGPPSSPPIAPENTSGAGNESAGKNCPHASAHTITPNGGTNGTSASSSASIQPLNHVGHPPSRLLSSNNGALGSPESSVQRGYTAQTSAGSSVSGVGAIGGFSFNIAPPTDNVTYTNWTRPAEAKKPTRIATQIEKENIAMSPIPSSEGSVWNIHDHSNSNSPSPTNTRDPRTRDGRMAYAFDNSDVYNSDAPDPIIDLMAKNLAPNRPNVIPPRGGSPHGDCYRRDVDSDYRYTRERYSHESSFSCMPRTYTQGTTGSLGYYGQNQPIHGQNQLSHLNLYPTHSQTQASIVNGRLIISPKASADASPNEKDANSKAGEKARPDTAQQASASSQPKKSNKHLAPGKTQSGGASSNASSRGSSRDPNHSENAQRVATHCAAKNGLNSGNKKTRQRVEESLLIDEEWESSDEDIPGIQDGVGNFIPMSVHGTLRIRNTIQAAAAKTYNDAGSSHGGNSADYTNSAARTLLKSPQPPTKIHAQKRKGLSVIPRIQYDIGNEDSDSMDEIDITRTSADSSPKLAPGSNKGLHLVDRKGNRSGYGGFQSGGYGAGYVANANASMSSRDGSRSPNGSRSRDGCRSPTSPREVNPAIAVMSPVVSPVSPVGGASANPKGPGPKTKFVNKAGGVVQQAKDLAKAAKSNPKHGHAGKHYVKKSSPTGGHSPVSPRGETHTTAKNITNMPKGSPGSGSNKSSNIKLEFRTMDIDDSDDSDHDDDEEVQRILQKYVKC